MRPMPTITRRLLPALLLPGCVLLGACGADTAAAPAPKPVPVTTAVAALRAVPVNAAAVGNVEALATVAVKSRVDGLIAQLHVRDGQDVRKDQLLLELDARPFEIELRQAEAALARDRALHAAAVVQEARYADLLKQGFVTPDQYAAIKGNLDTLQAAVQTGLGQIDTAKMRLSYTRISAPLAGRLGKIALQAGNLVRANDTSTLVTINQLDPVYVSFSLREQLLPAVRSAMKSGTLQAQVRDPQGGMPSLLGRLSFVDNAVDPATGTIRLRATFDNPQNLLWPGQFVSLILELGDEKNALTVPPVALLTGPKGPYLYVIGGDGKAEQREVAVARTTPDAAVITSGLKAGERVIVDGQSRVAPGAAVIEQP